MGHMDAQILWGLVAAVAAAGLLIAEHYFPINRVLHGHTPHQTINYILGCLALLGPFTVWGLALGHIVPVVAIWIITVAGGGAVLLCYGLDSALNARDSRKQVARLEDAIRRGPDDRAP